MSEPTTSADRFTAEHADEDVRLYVRTGDELWHVERERITVATAIDLLPQFGDARPGAPHVVTVDGTTYAAREPETVIAIPVNGEPANSTEYLSREGSHLVVAVTTGVSRSMGITSSR